jgi:hypothetical protein
LPCGRYSSGLSSGFGSVGTTRRRYSRKFASGKIASLKNANKGVQSLQGWTNNHREQRWKDPQGHPCTALKSTKGKTKRPNWQHSLQSPRPPRSNCIFGVLWCLARNRYQSHMSYCSDDVSLVVAGNLGVSTAKISLDGSPLSRCYFPLARIANKKYRRGFFRFFLGALCNENAGENRRIPEPSHGRHG